MNSNLEERLNKIKKSGASEAVGTNEESREGLLSFVVPTEFVDLPSKGKFYSDDHPLKDKDTLEIKQMTAREEDILTNKSFIKKGVVIDRLIESLLVDDSIDISSLLVGDKNAIMVAARISAYGPSYDVIVNCGECNAKNTLNIDLREIAAREAPAIIEDANSEESVNSERLENGNILIQLPKTGWIVECKLMNGVDERKILNLVEEKKRTDASADMTISEQLNIIINSIDTVTDRQTIRRAINSMPAYDAKHLRKIYQKMIPNVRIEKKFVCRSCYEEQELEVPFTQEFFWPK